MNKVEIQTKETKKVKDSATSKNGALLNEKKTLPKRDTDEELIELYRQAWQKTYDNHAKKR